MGTDIHGIFQKKTNDGWVDVTSDYDFDRHYALFAWLGNVRNGFGFAGVYTFDPIEPLSDNRGYPPDFQVKEDYHIISGPEFRAPWERQYFVEYKEHFDNKVWMGDHSHSWLSAEEILNTKPPVTKKGSFVTMRQYMAWDGLSEPDSWIGDIWGPGIKTEIMDNLLSPDNPGRLTSRLATHVKIHWIKNMGEEFDYFLKEVKRLQDLHGEVRFVFGFDS